MERKKESCLSFIIPVVVMITVFAIRGIWPFGQETVMTGDTTFQFVDYLSYYKTILFGNNDMIYSLSKGMGGEMAGFAAYYLLSPLNLLTLPFPREWLFAGIGLIIILTPGLASLSMDLSLTSIKGRRDLSLILSICYGLSGYIVVYNELFQYYTNIILLPPLFVLFTKLITGKRRLHPGYVLLLAFIMMNNYYTGYMICIFLVLSAVFHYVSGSSVGDGERPVVSFIIFALHSLLAAVLSGVVLLPAVLSLSGEKTKLALGLQLYFNPLHLFSKLYTGSFSGNFGSGLPNIYCGLIVTILLFFILSDGRLNKRKRICILGALLFFWITFCINPLNVAWHGFNVPIGFPFRQAFVVIFLSIWLVYENAAEDFFGFDKAGKIKLFVVFGLLMVYSIYMIFAGFSDVRKLSVAVTTVIVAAELAILYFKPRHAMLFLMLLTVADLSYDAYASLQCFALTSLDEYRVPLHEIESTERLIDDDGLYRVEKGMRRSHNDALMLNYPGLTHFSSSEKLATIDLLGKMGHVNGGNWAMYAAENTALSDCLLGVRYVMSKFDGTGKPYELFASESEDACYAYRNPYALPLMVSASGKVDDTGFSENPFVYQNATADAIAGEKYEILKLQDGVLSEGSDGISVRYDIEIKDDGLLYGYFAAPDRQDVTLYLDGDDWGEYFSLYRWNVVDLERRKKGDHVTVELRSNDGNMPEVTGAYFAVEDTAALKAWYEDVTRDRTELRKVTSSYYKGSCDTTSGTVFFSLPKDDGWHLYVDGQEKEIKEACGHMMSSKVGRGEHEIKLKFVSPGQKEGAVLSIFGVAVFLLLLFGDRRNALKTRI